MVNPCTNLWRWPVKVYQFWRPRSGFGEKEYIDQEAGNSMKQKLLEIKLLFGFKVNIYKFCKKEILIQPLEEPREQHLGDFRPKKFELHKNKMSGRVDIFWRIFKKMEKS